MVRLLMNSRPERRRKNQYPSRLKNSSQFLYHNDRFGMVLQHFRTEDGAKTSPGDRDRSEIRNVVDLTIAAISQLISAQRQQILRAIFTVREHASIGTRPCAYIKHFRPRREFRRLLGNPTITPNDVIGEQLTLSQPVP